MDLLQDILADFPPAVIVSRVGLLQIILDTIGSTCIQGVSSEVSFNPANAIKWMNSFLEKCITTFHKMFEGSTVSDLRNIDFVNKDADENASPSLALEMVIIKYLRLFCC